MHHHECWIISFTVLLVSVMCGYGQLHHHRSQSRCHKSCLADEDCIWYRGAFRCWPVGKSAHPYNVKADTPAMTTITELQMFNKHRHNNNKWKLGFWQQQQQERRLKRLIEAEWLRQNQIQDPRTGFVVQPIEETGWGDHPDVINAISNVRQQQHIPGLRHDSVLEIPQTNEFSRLSTAEVIPRDPLAHENHVTGSVATKVETELLPGLETEGNPDRNKPNISRSKFSRRVAAAIDQILSGNDMDTGSSPAFTHSTIVKTTTTPSPEMDNRSDFSKRLNDVIHNTFAERMRKTPLDGDHHVPEDNSRVTDPSTDVTSSKVTSTKVFSNPTTVSTSDKSQSGSIPSCYPCSSSDQCPHADHICFFKPECARKVCQSLEEAMKDPILRE